MKRLFFLLLAVICLIWTAVAFADEGMWLYNAFPKNKVKAKYGFEPTQACRWLHQEDIHGDG